MIQFESRRAGKGKDENTPQNTVKVVMPREEGVTLK